MRPDPRDLERITFDNEAKSLVEGHGLDPRVAPEQIGLLRVQVIDRETHQLFARALALVDRVGGHAAQPVLFPALQGIVLLRVEGTDADDHFIEEDSKVERTLKPVVGEVRILYHAAGPQHQQPQRVGLSRFDEAYAHV